MTTEVLSAPLSAGVQFTLPQGKFFYIVSATAALNLIAEGPTTEVVKFTGVGAGLKYGPVGEDKRWKYLRVTSAVAQNATFIVGDDDVSIANAVTIAGLVQVEEAPFSLFSPQNDKNVTAGTADTIAANLARKTIAIGNLSTNAANFRIAEGGGGSATRGIELQPGLFVTLKTTAALDVWNTGGADQSYWMLEQS